MVARRRDRRIRVPSPRSSRARAAGLDLLVNNAGFAGYRAFVELDPDVAEELIRVHVTATTRLTRTALPSIVERGAGAIVNVASLLAFSGSLPPDSLPQRVTYGACKAYMVVFTTLFRAAVAGSLAARYRCE